MKRSLQVFGMLLAGTTFFSSCTKDLKNDVKDLKGRVDNIENAIGSNEPIAVTTTFTDNYNKTRTINEVYRFKSLGTYTQYMEKYEDGSYGVYIERFSDVSWSEEAWVWFVYNPATKAITDKSCGHEWDNYYDNYRDEARFYSEDGATVNITVDKFDTNTGDVSLKVAASATGEYTAAHTSYSPNPGKPMSTSFSFSGKLKVLIEE